MNLYARIALLGGGGVIITAMAFDIVASKQTDSYVALAQKQADAQFSTGLSNVVTGVFRLVKTEANAESQKLSKGIAVANDLLSNHGRLSLSAQRNAKTIVNQDTGLPRTVMAPDLLIGGKPIIQNQDPNQPSPIVDDIRQLLGLYATVFQRIDSTGDMVRVATNLQDRKGMRAIGSYMPKKLRDGSLNPVVATVESGKTYFGRYQLFGEWYLTAYRPLYSPNNKLVGMLFVGLRLQEATQRIRESVIDTKIGDTGYAFVLGGSGKDFGRYIISQQGKRDGEYIWDIRDNSGTYTIRDMIAYAVNLKENQVGGVSYMWKNPGEKAPRMKVAKLMYFKPWDWVVGASAYEDEYRTYNQVLKTGRNRTVQSFIIAGFLISVIVIAISLYISWNIVSPIMRIKKAVQNMANGAYDIDLGKYANDEVGSLADSVGIMSRKLSESLKALSESEAKYRSLFDNSLEGIYITTVEGKILSANPAMASILGFESPESLVSSVTSIPGQLYYDPSDRLAILKELRLDNVVKKEVRLVRRDNKVIWGYLSLKALSVSDGKVVSLQGSVVDISERKFGEEQLTNNARRFRVLSEIDRAILENEDMIGMIDAILEIVVTALEVDWVRIDIIKGVRLSRCMSESGKAAGCENCIGKELIVTSKEMRQLEAKGFVKYEQSGDEPVPEFANCQRARTLRTLVKLPVTNAKELVGTLCIGSDDGVPSESWIIDLSKDIADHLAIAYSQAMMMADIRHQAEILEETVKSRTMQLEASNKELESFSYSVSHDLRSPLRVIDGFCSIVIEELGDKLDEETRSNLERIRASADRMGVLIDSLLQLSRISRLQMRVSLMDMSSIAKEVVQALEEEDKSRSTEWQIEEGIQCHGDQTLIRILLENILGNAWKYTSKKNAAQIAFGIKKIEGQDVYYVQDNGAGFDMRYSDKMFGAFQRMHRDNEFPGSGIGLATVERIIRKHGGKIWAEGEPDYGATFYFTLGEASHE